MKKQLLSIACLAALAPAFTAMADSGTLTEEWKAFHVDPAQPDANTYEGFKVGEKPCIRFATAMNGKFYVINQATNYIAEVDKDGIRDVYQLPASTLGTITTKKNGNEVTVDDFYGTAISRDDAGNFILGHCFTYEASSYILSVFQPSTGKIKHLTIPFPDDVKASRIDCFGRCLGDVTQSAVLYIAPASFRTDNPLDNQKVRIISFYGGGGDIDNVEASAVLSPSVYIASANCSVAQPSYATYDEMAADFSSGALTDVANSFYMYSGAYGAGSKVGSIEDHWKMMYCFAFGDVNLVDGWNNYSGNSGFDTFMLKGKRYFAMSYLPEDGDLNYQSPMDIAIFDDKGTVVASWQNSDFLAPTCYGSIIAEPVDDESVNIYSYACTARQGGAAYGAGVGIGAAKLVFKLGEVVTPGPGDDEPEYKGAGTQEDPYQLYSAADLCDMHNKIVDGQRTYFIMKKDIDMAGVTDYVPVIGSDGSTYAGEFDFNGNHHVIKNFAPDAKYCYMSIFGVVRGKVYDLGVVDCNVKSNSLGAGALAGYGSHGIEGCSIENCYVTGNVTGEGVYAGGLFGTNGMPVTVKNCYFNGNVKGTYAGGIVGRGRNGVVIENCYAYGTVEGTKEACGIMASDKNADEKVTATIKNVIAWNVSVKCAESAAPVSMMHGTQEGVLVWDTMTVNDVPVTDGVDFEVLCNTATSWEAYADDLLEGMPVLKWQAENEGVEGIIVDAPEAIDAAPVYYNLQGVQVENPAAGLYIVKRGNKVTKEIIR